MDDRKILRTVVIRKCAFPVDIEGKLVYDAQIWTSVDGGKTYGYCGLGKFCHTEQEAQEYAASIAAEEACKEKVKPPIGLAARKFGRRVEKEVQHK